jgi:VCBS repeat-containing protein
MISRGPLQQIMRIKKKLTLICVAALTGFFILSSTAFSATYYISSSQGKDTNAGLSASAPWKTFYRLKQAALLPGDSVYLQKGDTWREKLVLSGSGTSTQRITITSYGTGNKPVVNGSEVISGWSGGSAGIYMYVSSSVVERYAILEDGTPLKKASSVALADGNWFSVKSTIYYRPTKGLPKDHLVEASNLGALITLNTQHHITVDGLAFYSGSDGIEIIDGYEITIQNEKSPMPAVIPSPFPVTQSHTVVMAYISLPKYCQVAATTQ